MPSSSTEITASTLRAELTEWVRLASTVGAVVVTEGGRTVAGASRVTTRLLLDELVASGVVEPPRRARKPVACDGVRVRVSGPVADLVGDLRRRPAVACLRASVRRVGLTPAGAEAAGSLTGEHALGGADAVHLASALALGDDEVVFAVWDQSLRRGVRAAGLRLAPAADG